MFALFVLALMAFCLFISTRNISALNFQQLGDLFRLGWLVAFALGIPLLALQLL
jgi:hypothetical protein